MSARSSHDFAEVVRPPAAMTVIDRYDEADRAWTHAAVRLIRAEAGRSGETSLLRIPLPADWGIELYLKDESTHPTGSLKHRLARSLFLYALSNGRIRRGTPVIEASSGSTAISEAYFANLLGLPFIAVIPRATSAEKIALIKAQGGRCHFVDRADQAEEVSFALERESGGYFMNQFLYAERVTDWRDLSNVASTIYAQMAVEPQPIPEWIVVGAGTGGTSTTVGRHIRYHGHATRLCVVDPEGSALFGAFAERNWELTSHEASLIEGIGRPRVESSLNPAVIDRMARVPDAASIAAVRHLQALIGRRAGASTGTNLWAAFSIVAEMRAASRRGSVVTLLCDDGDRYVSSYYDDQWLAARGLNFSPYLEALRRFESTGRLDLL